MPNYEIVDWYYEKILDGEDFNKIGNIKDKILDNDKKGTAALWMEGRRWEDDVGPEIGVSLRQTVLSENDAYKDMIKGEIERANTETKLKRIKIGDYEEDTVKELTDAIKEKIDSLGRGVAEKEATAMIKDVENIIRRAKTQADIDTLPTRAELRRILGNEKAQELIGLSEKTSSQLVSLEEEEFERLFDKIGEASTNADLNRLESEINKTAHLTDDSTRELSSLIDEARTLLR